MEKTVLRQLDELNGMALPALRKRWQDLFGKDPGQLSRAYLVRRLAYRIQELAYGGLSRPARRELTAIANGAVPQAVTRPKRALRIQPGTRLVRTWHGDRYEVIAQEKGFLYDGQLYRSLSAVAKAITGTNWNGFLFFGIKKKERRQQT